MLSDPLKRYFSSYGVNHFEIDHPFRLALHHVGLPDKYEELLTQLGGYVGTDLLEIADYIDKVSPPRLQMFDINGQRLDWVRLNPAHQQALARLMGTGVVHRTFTEGAPLQLHYAMAYLIADPGIFCTITLTNQTAYALYKYADPTTQAKFLAHYLERDGSRAWHGATFYTEIQGGSDLGANRAVARNFGGAWKVFGEDKYFASNAGIADGALVTARPEGSPPGPKGLALFFVPALAEDGSANFTIRRLKEKLGTRAVPTGEATLQGSEAYLLGSVEDGIYQALEVLTLARLANAMGALGVARKAYLEALFYTQKRKTFGKPLIDHPLVQKDLLEMEVELEANLILGLKAIQAFDDTWQERPPYSDSYHYARLLTHLAKNMTAEMSARVTRMAMELHGGLGFLEDFPVARWHREALVTPIWEGGSNIQALDMLETITKKQSHLQLFSHIERVTGSVESKHLQQAMRTRLALLQDEVRRVKASEPLDAQYYAKDLLREIGECTAAAFLLEAAHSIPERNGGGRFLIAADAYIRTHLNHERTPMETLQHADEIIHLLPAHDR